MDELIEKIQLIPVESIKAGDVIVVTVSRGIEELDAITLKSRLRRYFPKNEIMIVVGMEISVKRAE